MQAWNLINIAKLYRLEHQPTWSNGHSESIIDYIWMSSNMANKTTTFQIEPVKEHFSTDHQYLQSIINITSLQTQPQALNKRKRRKIFNLIKATEEEWQDWKTEISLNIGESDIDQHSQQTLNQQWERLKKIITNTSRKHFGYKEIPRNYQQHTTEECNFHKAERILTKIIKATNEQESQEKIEELRKLQPDDAEKLAKSNTTQRNNLAKEIRKLTKKARYHQRSLQQHQKIQEAIEMRASSFETNKRKTLNSALERYSTDAAFDHLIYQDEIITKPQEILNTTDQIMTQWTRKRNTKPIPPGKWDRQYHKQPQHSYFDQLMEPITTSEMLDTLSQLPNNKSPGPSKIPNEFWKKGPPELLEQLRSLLNRCIEQTDTPQEWKQALIILIPKRNDWGGDLTNMRPITLIETARKILTKILTNRISTTCSNYQILTGDNFSVLKDTSTSTPIQIVNFLSEFSNQHKKPL